MVSKPKEPDSWGAIMRAMSLIMILAFGLANILYHSTDIPQPKNHLAHLRGQFIHSATQNSNSNEPYIFSDQVGHIIRIYCEAQPALNNCIDNDMSYINSLKGVDISFYDVPATTGVTHVLMQLSNHGVYEETYLKRWFSSITTQVIKIKSKPFPYRVKSYTSLEVLIIGMAIILTSLILVINRAIILSRTASQQAP